MGIVVHSRTRSREPQAGRRLASISMPMEATLAQSVGPLAQMHSIPLPPRKENEPPAAGESQARTRSTHTGSDCLTHTGSERLQQETLRRNTPKHRKAEESWIPDEHGDIAGRSVGSASVCADDVPAHAGRSAGLVLASLGGVRRSDEASEREVKEHKGARIAIEPIHAIGIMLILVVALAASLTMLVQQGIAMNGENPIGISTSVEREGEAGSLQKESSAQSVEQSAEPSQSSGDSQLSGNSQSSEHSQSTGNSQPSEPSGSSEKPEAGSGTADGLIDLNSATQEQLESISGIGPVTAQRILEYRQQAGRFSSVDELVNVKGIGIKTLNNLRPYVTVR